MYLSDVRRIQCQRDDMLLDFLRRSKSLPPGADRWLGTHQAALVEAAQALARAGTEASAGLLGEGAGISGSTAMPLPLADPAAP